MSGSSLAGGGTPAPPPSQVGNTPRPYRPGVMSGVMDMGAFATDMNGYWPLSSDGLRSRGSTGGWLTIVFLAGIMLPLHF